jgi:hypothetical protein
MPNQDSNQDVGISDSLHLDMLEEVRDIAMDQPTPSTMILPHVRMMATRFLDTASPDSKGISIAFVRSNRCVV